MNKEMYEKLAEKFNGYREWAIELQKDMIPLKAISPQNGGDGELKKCEYLEKVLGSLVDEMKRYDCEDKRTSYGFRPNLWAIKRGKSSEKRFFIVGHTDVVSEGEISLWKTDPWQAVVKDGKIYGRGSEDNQQALVSALCLLRALKEENITPPYDIVILFTADEECGNSYGIKWLIKDHKELFNSKTDFAIAPDSGKPEGDEISIAEKACLWIKATIHGKQAHGAYPNKGINAHFAGAEFVNRMEKLYDIFNETNDLFDPPYSSFEATKKEANVPNVNTIPGEDVVYFDCRFLPSIPEEAILKEVDKIKADIEKRRGVTITFEYPYQNGASATPKDSPITKATVAAAKDVYGVDANVIGISGGTIGAFLRKVGVDSVVYTKVDDVLHQPNEYCVIDNMIGDAKIMAHILCNI